MHQKKQKKTNPSNPGQKRQTEKTKKKERPSAADTNTKQAKQDRRQKESYITSPCATANHNTPTTTKSTCCILRVVLSLKVFHLN